ncbi:glycosyltransferase [Thalassobacillus hwangdonensis]|uniref:Glycosyltransferase n=1 Tax=Thalassobacillus hwangdonensis TaxID=546108 RepID=A0ABW3L2H8_9BACI
MKVLQINSVCGVGSTGRIATDIHKILVEQGHDSYIAYGRGDAVNCENAIRIGSKLDNYYHVAKTRILDRHGFASRKATEEFIKKVKMLDPDVIHLHNLHGYYIDIELLFKYLKEANKKVVWTLHDCWTFTGHCSHFEFVGCERWKYQCYNCPQKNQYPKSIGLDNSTKNYDDKKKIFTGVKDLTIVTPSEWLANLVNDSFLKDYPVKVINNGIDTEIFKPRKSHFKSKLGIEEEYVYLGVAGNWNDRKGFNYFIEMAQKLNENEVIVLVGVTNAQKSQLPRNIIGITHTNDVYELAKLYSCADVFVNPTLEDTFPTTNLEALACGTPVVTFDTGGSGESLTSGTGIVVKSKDTMDLIYNVRKAHGISSQYCLQTARKNYNKVEKFMGYLRHYGLFFSEHKQLK